MILTGCGTALVTPFAADGGLDLDALSLHVAWQIESGIRFLVACGSTGEASTLSDEEQVEVVEETIEAAEGRVPVLAGCTHNATAQAVLKARTLATLPGIGGLLTASPYYNKPSQEGQYRHFRSIAEAVAPLPIVLYNVPSRTGINLLPETVFRLVADVPNIIAIKESSGRPEQTSEILRLTQGMREAEFQVFSGDDNLALAGIGVGASGLISVASNEIPAEMSQMVTAALGGDWNTARRINRKYGQLIDANFWEPNPGPVKSVLELMGKMSGAVRLPLVAPERPTRVRLERVAGELGLLRDVPVPEGSAGLF